MTKITKFIAFIALLGWFSSAAVFAQNNYKICSDNKILNPHLDQAGSISTEVPNWTFTPAGDYYWGWRRDVSLIYGNTLFIDRKHGAGAPPNNTNTAASNTMTLCANNAKMVKFSFLSSNTGHYKMEVKLAGVTIGTFTHSGDLAQNIFTPAEDIVYSIFYNFWPSHYVTDNRPNNNIWHDFTIFIPHNKIAAASGSLEFIYAKSEPSRMVYLDNIEVYETIPAPVPTATEGVIDCSLGQTTFNLNTLLPDGAGTAEHLYTYKWYTDATHTNEVANPTAVKLGHYYLYATSVCAGCTSKASTPVRIDTKNCCETNVIKNNFFDDFTTSGNNPQYGPLANTPRIATIPNWQFNLDQYYAMTVGEFWGGHSVLSVDPASGGTEAPFWQEVKVCPGDVLEISMLYGMTRNAADFQNRRVDVMLDGVRLLSYNAWSRTAAVGGIDITIINVNPAVSDIRVAGNPYTTGQVIPENSLNRISFQYKVPANTPATTNFSFVTGQGALPYFDDVIIRGAAQTPAYSSISLACDQETGNLILCQPPASADFRYQWHTSSTIGSPLVPDPTKVEPGIYYMETISTCSGCSAAEYKPVTIRNITCPTISGKLYADFDGAANGINNNPGQGFNGGGMYALLINSSGNVINSKKIANDGSFLFRAASGTYRVMIHNKDVAKDNPAPTTSTLNTGYMHTGEGGGGGTINSDGTPNGIINNIMLGSSGETNVAFGINARPIVSNYRFGECGNGTTATYTFPLLRSMDDDPNWNEGRGQRIIIKTVSDLNNGVFKYDGANLSPNMTIAAYDPAKLTFVLTNAASPASGKFTYVYADKAGAESAAAGEVNYTVSRPAAITVTPATICAGESINLAAVVAAANNSGATYTFHTDTPATAANQLSNTVVSPTVTTDYYVLVMSPEGSACPPTQSNLRVNVTPTCDTDGDGIPDKDDLDKDNDGILDTSELYCNNPNLPVATTTGTGTFQRQLGFFDFTNAEWTAIGNVVTRTVVYNGVTYTATVTYTAVDNRRWSSHNNDLMTMPQITSVPRLSGVDINTWGGGPAQMIHRYYNVNANNFREVILLHTNQSLHGEVKMRIDVKAEKAGKPVPFQLVVFDAEATTFAAQSNWPEQIQFTNLGHGGFRSLEKTGPGSYNDEFTVTYPNATNPIFKRTAKCVELSADGRVLSYNNTDNPSKVNGLFETTNHNTSRHSVEVRVRTLAGSQAFGFAVRTLCDTDKDGTPNFLDVDSDGDGCPDAVEGDEKVLLGHLGADDKRIDIAANGGVNADGVPNLVNSGGAADIGGDVGQGVGASQDESNANACKNLWMGNTTANNNTWNIAGNWTQQTIPLTGEDVEFATAANFGEAVKADLHVPATDDKTIGKLTNASDKHLVVTPESRITIGGAVSNTSTGTIIVKAAPDKATGTLLFAKPAENADLPAVVEFYNKGYDCATCGFYTRKWQYFGIPVQQSPFPYSNPVVETVHQWSEPTNGNKWITPANPLTAFTGYEITNTTTAEPTNKYSFTGKLNLTDASVALTKTGGVNYSGMNLVANSYTAAIPIKEAALQFSTPLANKTVYLFNAGTRDQWRKLNGSTVTHDTRSGQYKAVPINVAGNADLPGIIPSMHTFMLQADAGSTLTIKYDQLVKNETVDGMAWRAAGTTSRREYPYIVMDIIGAQSADRVWLFENPATTRGFDNGWDGVKMPEAGVAQLYVSGDNDIKYQVATVPDMLGSSLGFAADADHHYSVSFSVTAEVESRQLYLQDLRTRQFIPIRNGSEAVVLGQKGDSGHRFKIVAKTAIANILSSVEIIANKRIISVVNHSDENCTAYVYDVTGRLAAQRPVKPKSTERIGMTMQGVYVVKVIGQTVSEAKRVMVD